MIFFYCAECKEELEAEDSIRGAKMKCPACFKEIEVPQVGVKVAAPAKPAAKRQRDRDRDDREGHTEPIAFSTGIHEAAFITRMLLIGLVGLIGICGVGYVLHKRSVDQADRARPKCDVCQGKRTVPCTICSGAKKQSCKECSGTGHRKNFRDQDEECYVCTGKGLLDCRTCGGRGEYGCKGCNGTGRIVPGK